MKNQNVISGITCVISGIISLHLDETLPKWTELLGRAKGIGESDFENCDPQVVERVQSVQLGDRRGPLKIGQTTAS